MASLLSNALIQQLQPLVEAMYDSKQKACLVGPHGAALAFVLSHVHAADPAASQGWSGGESQRKPRDIARSCLLILPTEDEASELYQDLQFCHSLLEYSADPLVFFPQRGDVPYEAMAPSIDLVAQRMQTLCQLAAQQPTVVVTSVQAVLQRLMPRAIFSEAAFLVKVGAVLERELLITRLLRLGYRRVSVVEIPGEFSVRGGIMDVFSTAYADPVRMEFLGNMVESSRLFDPATQESVEHLSQVQILPARECIGVGQEQSDPLSEFPPDEEWRCPAFYSTIETLADYFPDPPLVILNRPEMLAKEAENFWDYLLETWDQKASASDAFPYPAPDGLFLTWENFQELIHGWATVATEPLNPSEGAWDPVVSVSVQTTMSMGLGLKGRSFTDTLTTLNMLREKGLVVIVVRNAGQVGRLQTLLSEHDVPADLWRPQVCQQAHSFRTPFYLLHGELSSGFVLPAGHLAVVTEEDLFAKAAHHRPTSKSRMAKFFSSLSDLQVGGCVVHMQHGIGRYEGIRRLRVQDFESDYLILQFAGKDTLYVPLDRLNLVQPYRGGEQSTPKLDRLGGGSWARTTARVKKAIEDMAEELVELYANREMVTRRAYGEDSTLICEFDASFEYEETPDQLRVIQEIQRDMELAKPMDRLVCGDVGYGKTEIAMRASFKAVQDNRQVAMLVPTTLLAQQHYENFSKRFAAFPVRIGVLSRFQSPKEVKVLLSEMASGVVDIVIGTHRLLQKNVVFKNLGLVIIDEEQWFGVRHKERLKQLRTQVDVLTLTATPIPRTLQMAFSGVRDLSVIDTPPPGRLAIRTQVLRFDPIVVREAIRRELARDGQAFYVHNRVQTMEQVATWLQELVPEARIVMAHGQMPEHLLEKTMLTFFHGEADILVASAIIQSGLDVPRANTILVDRADTFGLAQLYQIRGRVGRAGDQAFAYFFYPHEETLSTDAQKRLQAIQEFADLGSGFRIAAADLEIRGSGNLLGKQQSGNIAAVGLDLYLHMVEQAVQRLKGQEVQEELDPTLHLNVSAYIPESYIDDGHQRLSFYKRLSASQQVGDLALLHGEIQDRYGPIPDTVERLFEVMQIRLLAKAVRLESLEVQKSRVVCTFDKQTPISSAGFQWLMDWGDDQVRLLSPHVFEIELFVEEWTTVNVEVIRLLQELAGYAGQEATPSCTEVM